jgi:hypothetical protein
MNLGAMARLGVTSAHDATTPFWVFVLAIGGAAYGALGLREVCRTARLPARLWIACTAAYLGAMFTLAYLLLSV